jgi:hypothetical protein
MIVYLFKRWLAFFYRYVPWGVFQENQCLLILDGHGFHVIIQAFEQAIEVGLNMVTLPTHVSHAL